jgi:hypothetical protein
MNFFSYISNILINIITINMDEDEILIIKKVYI